MANPVQRYENPGGGYAFIGDEGAAEAGDDYGLRNPELQTNSDPNNTGHTQSVISHLQQILVEIANTKTRFSQHKQYLDRTRTPSGVTTVVNAQR